MATDLEQKPVSQATAKVESYVAQELEKVRGRVRLLDAGGYLLLFLIITLAYGLVLALVDRAFELSTVVRLITFLAYLGAAGFCLVQAGLCFLRRVNPYYAARQLEQTLPETKNSIINWLDLRDEKLPPAIRTALGTRAAKDLKHADPERAVSSRLPLLLGAVALGLVLALLVLFVMENNRFGHLMSRVFAPFRDIDLGTQTTITLLQPEGGDVTVAINRPVHFRVRIDGRVPAIGQQGAPRLLYRYNHAEPYDDNVGVPLDEDRDGTWFTTMVGDQVQTGFWYKITAGDAQTPEYQVTVRTFPLVTRYEVTYHYRPYRKIPDQSITFPNDNAASPSLKAHRGTEVTLLVRTNRNLKHGHLEFTYPGGGRRDVEGEVAPNDPEALRFKFVMERTGTFRVLFTSKENEENSNPSAYPIDVLDDGVPTVELTKPGEDVALEANRTLTVEGSASDDFAIKKMLLRLRVLEGAEKPDLAPLVYREGTSLALDDGSYPRTLEYNDLIHLAKIKTAKGADFPLAKGMVLQYWLEAIDHADYPNKDGNVGRSKPFKITILDPHKDQKKVDAERHEAEKRKEEHNQKQDQQIAEESRDKKNAQNPQNNNPQEDPKKKDDLEKTREKLKNDANELDKARREQEREQKKTGEAKGGEPEKSECKKGGEQENGKSPGELKDQKPQDPDKPGEPKNDGANGQKDKAGQARDAGKRESSSEAKDAQNQPPPSAKGSQDNKGPEGKQANPSEAAGAKSEPKENPAAARDQGGKTDQKNAQAKEGGPESAGQPKAENKESGKESPGAQAKKEKGSDGKQANPSESAGAKEQPKDNPAAARDQGNKNDQKTAQAKEGGSESKGQPKADNKQAGKQSPGAHAKNEKGDGSGQPQAAKAEHKDGPTSAKDHVAQAKDRGPDHSKKKPPTGASKPGEENMEGNQPATAKPGERQEPKSVAKGSKEPGGAPGQPKAEAKDSGPTAKNGETQGRPKHADPKQDKIAEGKGPGNPDPKSKLDPADEKALEHIAKLAEKLNSPDKKTRDEALKTLEEIAKNLADASSEDQKTRDDAAKALEELAKNAKDPDAREAAKNLLERAKREAQAKGSEKPETKTAQGEQKSGQTDTEPPAQAKGKEPGETETGSAKNEMPKEPNEVAHAKPGTPRPDAANFGPKGQGVPHVPKDWDPTAAFSKPGGELNLEDIKDKITPEMRKAAGWTEERWHAFLKAAEAYNRELAKLSQDPTGPEGKNTAPGGKSKLPSQAPRAVRASEPGSSGAQVGQPQPPLEFREIYRNFTRPDAAPPKKK